MPACGCKSRRSRLRRTAQQSLELVQYLTHAGGHREPATNLAGSAHLCFQVDDIHGAYEALKRSWRSVQDAPVAITSGPNEGGLGVYLCDPDGFVIELFQPSVRDPQTSGGRGNAVGSCCASRRKEQRMLTILGKPQKYSEGCSRRDFLRIGSVTGMLSLAEVLRCQDLAKAADPTRAASKKSVIMVYLLGGPAQLDTYDPKPNAPSEFRGEFKPIKTNVPGIEISELFPKQAAMMDKFALIRSLSATAPNGHSDSEIMTGRTEVANSNFQYPSIGSIVSKLREAPGRSVPGYVALRKMTFPTKTPSPIWQYYLNPASLGQAHCAVSADRQGHGRFRLCAVD